MRSPVSLWPSLFCLMQRPRGDFEKALPIDCWLSTSLKFSIPKSSNTKPAFVRAGMALFFKSDENIGLLTIRRTTCSLPWIEGTGFFKILDSNDSKQRSNNLSTFLRRKQLLWSFSVVHKVAIALSSFPLVYS